MPPFSLGEMAEHFEHYQKEVNFKGVPLDIQRKITEESAGHPATFMLYLKMYDHLRPTLSTWLPVEQEKLS